MRTLLAVILTVAAACTPSVEKRESKRGKKTEPVTSPKPGDEQSAAEARLALSRIDDPNPEIRKMAISTLARTGSSLGEEDLKNVVGKLKEVSETDPDESVRAWAVEALQRIFSEIEADEPDTPDDEGGEDDGDDSETPTPPVNTSTTYYAVVTQCVAGATQLTDDPKGPMKYDVTCSPIMETATIQEAQAKASNWTKDNCPSELVVDRSTNINGDCVFRSNGQTKLSSSNKRSEIESDLANGVCEAEPDTSYGFWDCSAD